VARPVGNGRGEPAYRIRCGEVAVKRIGPTCPLPADRIRDPPGRHHVAGREEDLCAAYGERLGQKSARATCRARDGDAQTIKIHGRQ
jgi:hypothetical protein